MCWNSIIQWRPNPSAFVPRYIFKIRNTITILFSMTSSISQYSVLHYACLNFSVPNSILYLVLSPSKMASNLVHTLRGPAVIWVFCVFFFFHYESAVKESMCIFPILGPTNVIGAWIEWNVVLHLCGLILLMWSRGLQYMHQVIEVNNHLILKIEVNVISYVSVTSKQNHDL